MVATRKGLVERTILAVWQKIMTKFKQMGTVNKKNSNDKVSNTQNIILHSLLYLTT